MRHKNQSCFLKSTYIFLFFHILKNCPHKPCRQIFSLSICEISFRKSDFILIYSSLGVNPNLIRIQNLSLDIHNDLQKIILYVEVIIFFLLIYYLLFVGGSENKRVILKTQNCCKSFVIQPSTRFQLMHWLSRREYFWYRLRYLFVIHFI